MIGSGSTRAAGRRISQGGSPPPPPGDPSPGLSPLRPTISPNPRPASLHWYYPLPLFYVVPVSLPNSLSLVGHVPLSRLPPAPEADFDLYSPPPRTYKASQSPKWCSPRRHDPRTPSKLFILPLLSSFPARHRIVRCRPLPGVRHGGRPRVLHRVVGQLALPRAEGRPVVRERRWSKR